MDDYYSVVKYLIAKGGRSAGLESLAACRIFLVLVCDSGHSNNHVGVWLGDLFILTCQVSLICVESLESLQKVVCQH